MEKENAPRDRLDNLLNSINNDYKDAVLEDRSYKKKILKEKIHNAATELEQIQTNLTKIKLYKLFTNTVNIKINDGQIISVSMNK